MTTRADALAERIEKGTKALASFLLRDFRILNGKELSPAKKGKLGYWFTTWPAPIRLKLTWLIH